jgi:plastocyanin
VIVIFCAAGAAACGGGGEQGSGGGPAKPNGCDPMTAEDHTAESVLTITFGGPVGTAYAPRCAKIKAGSGVLFQGDFGVHPLAGGMDGRVDAASPIEETNAGMMAEFDALPKGTYPYFCEDHDTVGMNGAIFVE